MQHAARNNGNPARYTMILMVMTALLTVGIGSAVAQTESGTKDARKGGAAVKRDPFWPVGYTPKKVQTVQSTGVGAKAVDNSWDEAMKRVVINGVSSRADNEYFAVINGEVKRVGETVSVSLGGSVYTWAVDSIVPPGSVKLRRVSVR